MIGRQSLMVPNLPLPVPALVLLLAGGSLLRGLQIPLSKYSYLTQTALVAIAGSLLVGLPATALALAVAHCLQASTRRAGECQWYFSGVIYFARCDEMKAAISQGIPFL